MGSRGDVDSSDEPIPPRRTLLDWVGTVVFALVGVVFLLSCVASLGEVFEVRRFEERLLIVVFCTGILGVPGGLLCWQAWRMFTGRKARWRRTMRVRRRLCIRCGYDLRGGVKKCPECGKPVPESIDRIAARLEMMTGGGNDGKEERENG